MAQSWEVLGLLFSSIFYVLAINEATKAAYERQYDDAVGKEGYYLVTDELNEPDDIKNTLEIATPADAKALKKHMKIIPRSRLADPRKQTVYKIPRWDIADYGIVKRFMCENQLYCGLSGHEHERNWTRHVSSDGVESWGPVKS